jgi:hypothetical protein
MRVLMNKIHFTWRCVKYRHLDRMSTVTCITGSVFVLTTALVQLESHVTRYCSLYCAMYKQQPEHLSGGKVPLHGSTAIQEIQARYCQAGCSGSMRHVSLDY